MAISEKAETTHKQRLSCVMSPVLDVTLRVAIFKILIFFTYSVICSQSAFCTQSVFCTRSVVCILQSPFCTDRLTITTCQPLAKGRFGAGLESVNFQCIRGCHVYPRLTTA